jgi:hypothetical protein
MNLLRRLLGPVSHEPLPTFRIESWADIQGAWSWTLYTAEGARVCMSDELFRTERGARRGARRALAIMRCAVVE